MLMQPLGSDHAVAVSASSNAASPLLDHHHSAPQALAQVGHSREHLNGQMIQTEPVAHHLSSILQDRAICCCQKF